MHHHCMPIARRRPIARLSEDFVTCVPAVKTNAFPLYVYSEDSSHACGVATSLLVTANPLEADSGAIATVSHNDSTTQGPGRHRARANRTSTTTTTTKNNNNNNNNNNKQRCRQRSPARGPQSGCGKWQPEERWRGISSTCGVLE